MNRETSHGPSLVKKYRKGEKWKEKDRERERGGKRHERDERDCVHKVHPPCRRERSRVTQFPSGISDKFHRSSVRAVDEPGLFVFKCMR